jgi:starch phosphorylase
MDDTTKFFPHVPEQLSQIGSLAYNLWWSWHPSARMVFKNLDRVTWKESLHNPVRMLEEIPPETLESAVKNQTYLSSYTQVLERFRADIGIKEGWFSSHIADPEGLPIAYFSAEFGLHHSLPFFAGGLGFLAGDFIKECSDLGVPMVAVGIMYPEGYIRQKIRTGGRVEDIDETLDRDAAPVQRVLDERGGQLIVQVPFTDPPIHVAVWKVMVGRVPLYLMDTDIEINAPWDRRIALHLYIGDNEQRLRQEIVLGIGGTAVLHALGIRHSITHLNEGHPAFVLLERIRERISEGMGFEEAAREVRQTSLFTTHTPVPAGTDVFPFSLMDKYFNGYYSHLGLTREAFLRLGEHPDDPSKGFNMTVFALKMSGYRNGVSRRHGEVARRIWNCLWPDLPVEQVPIGHVTNGVHVPTWIEPRMRLLLNRYLHRDWQSVHDDPETWEGIHEIPDGELWQTHYRLKAKLINIIHEQARKCWVERRADPSLVVAEGALLDPSILTIGFARRFTGYKRADLIFHDPDRLRRMLQDRWKPVQFIFAGKAHPNDEQGKQILQRVFNFAMDPDAAGRIAFVENYDEMLAQYMTHGVDVWLNNPLPPLEASGTSGMKAALNGVPHLSVLDGWWLEGYNGNNGWALEHRENDGDPDALDAESIYRILEEQIIPLYYRVSDDGIPHDWVRMMKESIRTLAPRFSARRMAKEYLQNYYARIFANSTIVG